MRIDCGKAKELIDKDLKMEMLSREERDELLNHTTDCQSCRKYYMQKLNLNSDR